jgi:hypothetical protein
MQTIVRFRPGNLKPGKGRPRNWMAQKRGACLTNAYEAIPPANLGRPAAMAAAGLAIQMAGELRELVGQDLEDGRVDLDSANGAGRCCLRCTCATPARARPSRRRDNSAATTSCRARDT